jgi:hypothetical protein
MSETYVIKKIMEPFTDDVWEQIPTLRVQNFPWDENGYKPETIAKICYSDKAIHVFLKSFMSSFLAMNHLDPPKTPWQVTSWSSFERIQISLMNCLTIP